MYALLPFFVVILPPLAHHQSGISRGRSTRFQKQFTYKHASYTSQSDSRQPKTLYRSSIMQLARASIPVGTAVKPNTDHVQKLAILEQPSFRPLLKA